MRHLSTKAAPAPDLAPEGPRESPGEGLSATPVRPSRRRIVAWVLLALLVLGLPFTLNGQPVMGYLLTNGQILGITLPEINLALVAVVAAVALNVLVGRTGLVSLGHAAFFAVGAIVAAVCGVQWGLPFLVTLVLAGVVGAVVGVIVGLPSMRLQGLYLMLATLALHYIALYLLRVYQLEYFGPSGITFGIPSIFSWELANDTRWYFFLVLLVTVTLVVVHNVNRSRVGGSFIALRDHSVAASALGMNVARLRLASFAFSSFLVSIAGATYAYVVGHVTESTFTLGLVISYFAMVILGGMGSTLGAVLGALVWSLLPSLFDLLAEHVDPSTPVLGSAVSTYQGQVVSILMGLVIILVLRFWPTGLAGLWESIRLRLAGSSGATPRTAAATGIEEDSR